VIERRAAGLWDLDECRVAYLRHLRAIAAGRNVSTDLTAARTRSAIAAAEIKGLQAAELRGELVHVDDIRRHDLSIALVIRARALAMPSRIAARWGMTMNAVEANELVRSEVFEMLSELSALTGEEAYAELCRLMGRAGARHHRPEPG
jgi:hypothetical protein